MKKQIYYTFKFKSSRLAEFDFNIEGLTVSQGKLNKEIISMFDSQLLRSLRNIKGSGNDIQKLESLKKEMRLLHKGDPSLENAKKINKLQNQIDELLFVPEIISIVIENRGHYKYLYRNGLRLNGKLYRRFSCSAGQARASTVLFCETNAADKLDEIFDNGRNKEKKLVPSKYNAYKGLITSSTSVVSTPRFALIPDYESPTNVKVNFVTETDINADDKIEIKEITEMFNRFDGQGIIDISLARKWADELGLDYIPSQWCIRQNYIKGMLSTFDIKDFCEKKNNGNYIIETSYTNEDGSRKTVDLRNIDVLISESQFKLWNSFPSLEVYKENCIKNKLDWGISLVSPKQDKDILRMNYQFLQTLNLSDKDIEKLCEKFVRWICGVTSEDIYYTLLFLLGTENDEDQLMSYIENSDNHWVKALMIDHELINDSWFKKKIYDLVKQKIKNACLGQIVVDGNFQVIVSDPYAMMQHACGIEVTGLLGKNEYYSNYWNKKGVKMVDSMRAPLTYRSEHVLLPLQDNEELNYWYKYNTSGIIVNTHGYETMQWAGSDFDMDIIATTSDETVIKGVYRDELPIAYTPPKPNAVRIKDKDLYNSDLHSFGSEIGQITNKSTSGFALLAQLDEGTEEYITTLNRIKMCTKLQSAQIDKAKIGRKVKSIPKIWTTYNRITEDDTELIKEQKSFLNEILLHKHPYFFTYLYKGTKKKYRQYYKNQDATCQQLFGINLDELKKLNRKTTDQLDFLKTFNTYSPVIDSDCVMNNLCKYIESIDFGIRNIIKSDVKAFDTYKHLLRNHEIDIDQDIYNKVKKAIKSFNETSKELAATHSSIGIKDNYNDELKRQIKAQYDKLKMDLFHICSNEELLTDHLIHLAYTEQSGFSKELLWTLFGKQLVNNLKLKCELVKVPLPCPNGEIDYLNKKYTVKEVVLVNE